MAGVNVKMGVTGVSEFKKGMKDAESAVSTLNSALKLNEEELKAAGNQEQYLKNKTDLLKAAIEKQTEVVRNAEAAIKAMRENGVSEASAAFQKMQKKVYDSQTKLANLNTELKGTETGAKDAGNAISGIGKNVSWDNIAEGIGKINDQLMNAGRAAVNFGKKISRSVMSSAEWADQLKTMSEEWDLSPEKLQRMQNVAEIIDTDVEAILNAQSRMKNAATTKGGVKAIEETLGISLNGQSADDLFWEIGDALMNMSDAYMQESAARDVFGRSWRELLPLFKAGREEYEKMLADQKVMSNEDVYKLGNLDDTIQGLKQQVELIKNQFIADNADKIQGFLQWLVDNADGVKTALIAIGAGFGALKVAEVAANVGKIVSGFQTLGLAGGGGAASEAAAAATASETSGLAAILGAFLDKVTPIAAAIAASNAFDPMNSPEIQQFYKDIEGMNPAEVNKHLMQTQFGWTDEQYYQHQWDKLQEEMNQEPVEVTVEPIAEDGAAEDLAKQVGTVTVPAEFVYNGSSEGKGFANGLPFVPFDGYPAILHKGERVVPAREVAASRNFSSNLYVESMYMNNGTDADGLAAAMAAAQRRTMSGYGS